jgi:hypothetical protein
MTTSETFENFPDYQEFRAYAMEAVGAERPDEFLLLSVDAYGNNTACLETEEEYDKIHRALKKMKRN